jgi:hypothetical protein
MFGEATYPMIVIAVLAGTGLAFYLEGEIRRRVRRSQSLRRLDRVEWLRVVSGLRQDEVR